MTNKDKCQLKQAETVLKINISSPEETKYTKGDKNSPCNVSNSKLNHLSCFYHQLFFFSTIQYHTREY